MEKKTVHSYVIRLLCEDLKGNEAPKYFTGIRNLGIWGIEAAFTKDLSKAMLFHDYQAALKKRPGFRWQVVTLDHAKKQHPDFTQFTKN